MSNQEIGLSGISSGGEEPKQISFKQEISDVLQNQPSERHSFFQLRYFLIGKEPTNQSKMWQCLRELKSRKESIDSLELEYEEQKDRLELLGIEESMLNLFQKEAQNELEELKSKETNIKIKQIKRKKTALISSLDSLINKKRFIEEESHFFLEMFKTLQKVEPLRPFDDIEAQKEYWSEKLTQKLNLKMLTGGQLDTELVETVIALPDEIELKKQVLNTLSVRRSQMVKAMEQTVTGIDKSKG